MHISRLSVFQWARVALLLSIPIAAQDIDTTLDNCKVVINYGARIDSRKAGAEVGTFAGYIRLFNNVTACLCSPHLPPPRDV